MKTGSDYVLKIAETPNHCNLFRNAPLRVDLVPRSNFCLLFFHSDQAALVGLVRYLHQNGLTLLSFRRQDIKEE
ncbi:MAG: hypothetical protein JW874_05090 [Spirochaetales bacterium]|nr:hypothetical protein [Spirochaetales bacterium]